MISRRDRGPRWLLCLHGLQSDHTLFQPLLADPAFGSFSVLAPDIMDFGHDLLSQADGVAALLEKEAIPAVTIVGHSLGGMIGILLLRQIPQKIVSLVSLEGNLAEPDCGESLRISRLTRDAYPGKSAVFHTAKSIVQWSTSGELATIFRSSPHPKLLLLGEKSPFHSRPIAPNLKTQIIPNAGHFLFQDNPADTLKAIRDFL